MIKITKLILLLVATFFVANPVFSSIIFTNDSLPDYYDDMHLRFEDHEYNKQIKTVRMYPEFKIFDEPVLKLNSNEHLILDFDDLSSETKDYYYKITHCTSNWESSNLSYYDYMDGFEINQIRDYDFSFNTYFNYIHYILILPNQDVQLKYSGNYLIQVFEDFDEEKLILSRRFYVVEDKVSVDAEIKRATLIDKMDSYQELIFTLNSNVVVNNPYKDIKVVITQNGRWDNRSDELKPLFINDGKLVYNNQQENIFPGVNEFRYFNTKDIKFESQGIDRIEFIRPYYHFFLSESKLRRFKVYFYDEDLDGNYAIDIANGRDMDIEADYVFVHFSLPYEVPIVDGNLYIYGELSDWAFNPENKMKYDFKTKAYHCTLLLKQGYYNYLYAYVKDGEQKADISYIEGNHYQTENNYFFYVYLKDNSSRYERLVGFQKFNSLKKI